MNTPTHVFQFIFLFMLQKICIGDGCHVEDIYIQHLEVKHVRNGTGASKTAINDVEHSGI